MELDESLGFLKTSQHLEEIKNFGDLYRVFFFISALVGHDVYVSCFDVRVVANYQMSKMLCWNFPRTGRIFGATDFFYTRNLTKGP